jgi:hypothetical protein
MCPFREIDANTIPSAVIAMSEIKIRKFMEEIFPAFGFYAFLRGLTRLVLNPV